MRQNLLALNSLSHFDINEPLMRDLKLEKFCNILQIREGSQNQVIESFAHVHKIIKDVRTSRKLICKILKNIVMSMKIGVFELGTQEQ